MELIIVRQDRPRFRCLVCQTPLHEDTYERHVARCVRRHEQQLRELSPAHTLPGLFGPEVGDVELERWVRRNRQAVADGRLKM